MIYVHIKLNKVDICSLKFDKVDIAVDILIIPEKILGNYFPDGQTRISATRFGTIFETLWWGRDGF